MFFGLKRRNILKLKVVWTWARKTVQVVQPEAYRGAAASWVERFRFKHLATDMYLSVEQARPCKAENGSIIKKQNHSLFPGRIFFFFWPTTMAFY